MKRAIALTLFTMGMGCSPAKMIDKATLNTMMPGIMPVSDVGMVCTTGTALAPLATAISSDAPPHNTTVLTMLAAGMCADLAVWEAELERRRAPHEGRGAAVVDLLEKETRLHEEAARRYFAAWQSLEAAHGPIGEGCPSLRENRGEDALYLLGLSSGLLAMIHDRAAQGVVGVPMDIPPKVARATECLNDDVFWAVPSALAGAIQASLPGPDQAGGFERLATAAARGNQTGVRLAAAFQIQTLSTTGQDDALREAITEYANATAATDPDPQWRLLDSFAHRLIRHESDRIWMMEEGQRTPMGSLGTFPGSDAFDFGDDLLRDLLPAAPEEATEEAPSEEQP